MKQSTSAKQQFNSAIAPYMAGYVAKTPTDTANEDILGELDHIAYVRANPHLIVGSTIKDEAGAERWEVLAVNRTSESLNVDIFDRYMEGNTSAVWTAAGETELIHTALADLLPYETPADITPVLLEVPSI